MGKPDDDPSDQVLSKKHQHFAIVLMAAAIIIPMGMLGLYLLQVFSTAW